MDFGDGASADEVWPESKHRTVSIDLRFCNILDGYIPLVKDIRSILPPLAGGEAIEVSWQDDPGSWFPCSVSKRKRAIYNLDRRLRDVFWRLPSGVRLYVTRVASGRYQLSLKGQPHVVRNCKFFIPDGLGGWNLEIRDELVEWETGDEVFRHQLNFTQMEALHDEARRTNLSVRDAVYRVMRLLAQSQPIHVRTVHDAVFLLRSCSLAAVWAQFRPEHECYVREKPGWYRFDPSRALPTIRIIQLPAQASGARRTYSAPYSKREGRYMVKERGERGWRFNIYKSRLEEFERDAGACLEVRCAFGTPNEVVFVIPIQYLMEHVIPQAQLRYEGRYLFSVNPRDFVFTWDQGIRMEGNRFLDRK